MFIYKLTACVLVWLLHQKGLFDPLYDWYEDHFDSEHHHRLVHTREHDVNHRHHHRPHHHQLRHGVKTHTQHRRTTQQRHKHRHHRGQDDDVNLQKMLERTDNNESHYYQQLHRVHKDGKHKQHRRVGKHGIVMSRDVHADRRRRERLKEEI